MRIRKVGIYTGKFYAGLLCVLLAGVLLGSLFYGSMSADTVRSLNSVQAGFLSVRQNLDFSKILLKTLSSSTAFLFVIFASGFCAVGQPAAAAALALRGLGLGVVLVLSVRLHWRLAQGRLYAFQTAMQSIRFQTDRKTVCAKR